jgi:hypothetical protein
LKRETETVLYETNETNGDVVSQIFISHSQRDETIKNLFLRAFRGTGVTDVYREYEDAPPTGVKAEDITRDIELSSAVFVLLSETVESLPHTRDWILFECGVAAAKQKPVWVFEPYESFGRITTAIPRFDHYIRFNDNDIWRQYIHQIAASHNDNPMLARVGLSLLGAWLIGWPAAVGIFLVSQALLKAPECPTGYRTQCPKCLRMFIAHLPYQADAFRCPNCAFQSLHLASHFVPQINGVPTN